MYSHCFYSTLYWIFAKAIRQEKEIEDAQIGMKEVRLSPFAGYMCVCVCARVAFTVHRCPLLYTASPHVCDLSVQLSAWHVARATEMFV